jgi:hypothetical protein
MTNDQIKKILTDRIKELESKSPVDNRAVIAELLDISKSRYGNIRRIEMGFVMDEVMKKAGLSDIWEVFQVKFWEV